MKRIMFNDRYGLTRAVLEGRKTMTRRIATTEEIQYPNIGWALGKDRGKIAICNTSEILAMSRYARGEVVAIAQAYKELDKILAERKWKRTDDKLDKYYRARQFGRVCDTNAGWNNKMFVQADLLPHHIKITDIKVERLQDISDKDCLKEGIFQTRPTSPLFGWDIDTYYGSPRDAFAALIDKVGKKGIWQSNPWCFCYSFELID